jgi:hypothetical protein
LSLDCLVSLAASSFAGLWIAIVGPFAVFACIAAVALIRIARRAWLNKISDL